MAHGLYFTHPWNQCGSPWDERSPLYTCNCRILLLNGLYTWCPLFYSVDQIPLTAIGEHELRKTQDHIDWFLLKYMTTNFKCLFSATQKSYFIYLIYSFIPHSWKIFFLMLNLSHLVFSTSPLWQWWTCMPESPYKKELAVSLQGMQLAKSFC